MTKLGKDNIKWLREFAGLQETHYGRLEDKQFTVEFGGKRYILLTRELEDPDGFGKISHYVIDEHGREHYMNWSPYSIPTEEEVIKWLELGMPDGGGRPLDSKSLSSLS